MKPDGETVQRLNQVMAARDAGPSQSQAIASNAPSQRSTPNTTTKPKASDFDSAIWLLSTGTGDDKGLAPANSGTHKPPPVPGYKSDFFKQRRPPGEWSKQNDSFSKLPDVTDAERRAYMEIFAAEGGGQLDPANGAAAGITRTTMNDLIDKGFLKGVSKGTAPVNLTGEDRAKVYRAYSDFALKDVGGRGAKAYREIGDPEAAAVLGDTLIRHGRNEHARFDHFRFQKARQKSP